MLNRILGTLAALLGVAALSVHLRAPSRSVLVAGLACVAAAGLVWFFVTEFESFRSFSKKRSTRLGLNSLLMVLFFGFILVLLNLMFRQVYFRADFSTTGRYTLSDQSRRAAESVDRDLRIAVFGRDGDRDYDRMRDLLAGYTHINRKIIPDLRDLDRSPGLARRFGVSAYNTVVVFDEEKALSAAGADEQTVTNLIIRFMRPASPLIVFLRGHGERLSSGDDRRDLGGIVSDLRAMGFRVEDRDGSSAEAFGGSPDLVVLAGPRRALEPPVRDRIDTYVRSGGKLLLLIDDPRAVRPLLESYDVGVSTLPVSDPQHRAGADPTVPLVNTYFPDVSFMKDFSAETVFPSPHALNFRQEGWDRGRFEYMPLVRSSKKSWLDENADGLRNPHETGAGQKHLAAVLKSRRGLSRIVVFGNVDFVSNAYHSIAGNRTLFLNGVKWLLGEGRLLEIAPEKRRVVPLYITDSQATWVRVATATVPTVFAVMGVALWGWRRRL